MKKYLSLFLVTIMLLALLISCTIPQETDTNFSDNASTNDTNSDTASDNNTNLPDNPTEPPNDNQPDDPPKPPEKTHTATWQFDYTYWYVSETTTGEPLATLLVNDGFLGIGFDEIVIPKDITAGDTITIEYTGDIEIAESFPAHIYLQDGEVISYSFSYAEVISKSIEIIAEAILDYDAPNNYVILDRSGKYTTLDEYKGDTVYFVKDQSIQTTENSPLYVACMLAYNPRDLEDGIPQYGNISESEAKKIAHDHYYNTYFVNYGEIFEYETSIPESIEGYWEVHIKEYIKIERAYCYRIDKITGEIVSVEIVE